VYLQASVSWLTALTAGISSGALGVSPIDGGMALRLVSAIHRGGNLPDAYVANTTVLAAMITPGTRSIAIPPLYAPSWLQIPVQWVAQLAAASGVSMPNDGPLQISAECALDARGYWATAFQTIGWTPFVPSTFPVPLVDC
jgi:hypothetical protein